jgi:hypothetical protein
MALAPGLLAFVFGYLAFRSRVTGVYLSIITQAMTYALMLAFFRNDMGFGGNNGLTDFKDILGFNLQSDATHAGLLIASAACSASSIWSAACWSGRGSARCWWRSAMPRAGAVPGLPGRALQGRGLRLLGGDGGARRRALCAAGRHHQSGRVRAGQFD